MWGLRQLLEDLSVRVCPPREVVASQNNTAASQGHVKEAVEERWTAEGSRSVRLAGGGEEEASRARRLRVESSRRIR